MDLLQDSSHTMLGLDARLRGFLEHVNRLQEANRRLNAQIADWGVRSTSRFQDWSQQEQTVHELRAQVQTFDEIFNYADYEKVLGTAQLFAGKRRNNIADVLQSYFHSVFMVMLHYIN